MSLTKMITKFNIGIKKNFNADAFKRDIDEIDWSLAIGNTGVNLDFSNTLHIDAPVKKTSRKIQIQKIKPWVTRGKTHSMQIRAKLYKKFIKSKNNQTHKMKKAAFKKYQNKLYN